MPMAVPRRDDLERSCLSLYHPWVSDKQETKVVTSREERLKAALRANLRKRKARDRESPEAAGGYSEDTADSAKS